MTFLGTILHVPVDNKLPLIVVAYVLAERCNTVDECADTMCGVNASHIECDHHYCTCVADAMSKSITMHPPLKMHLVCVQKKTHEMHNCL